MGVSVRVSRNTRVYLPWLVAIPVWVIVAAIWVVVLVIWGAVKLVALLVHAAEPALARRWDRRRS